MTATQPQSTWQSSVPPALPLTASTRTLQQRIHPRQSDAPAELSSRQQQLWYLYQLHPTSPVYNVAFLLHLHGDLDRAALERSLNEIVRRHDTLRTRVTPVGDLVLQVIAPPEPTPLTCIDLSDRDNGEGQLRALIQTAARRAFVLEREPLVRFLLIKLGDDRHALFFNLHHIIADQWSVQILLQELVTLYPAFVQQESSPLPDLTVQYADCAEWQHQQLQGDPLKKLQHFWQEQLQHAPDELTLPTDFPHTRQTFVGSIHPVQLSPQLVKDLTRLGRSCKATPFMVMMAALQTLLYRYSQQADIVVGFPIAARSSQEMESVIGYFANTLALRTSFANNPTVRELLYQVKAAALSAYTHQALPFEKVVEVVNPRRNECHNPIFQTLLVLQNTPLAKLQLPGLELRLEQLHNGTAKFDLSLELHEAEGGLDGWFEYRTDLFEPATIAQFARHFEALLTAMIANPDQRVDQLPLLSHDEQQHLLNWSETTYRPVTQCVHERFAAQVNQNPQAIAVRWREQSLTYADLNRQANQLAHFLIAQGVVAEQIVGVCMERSPALIVVMLAIMKAGGAYLPLDASYPSSRLQQMIQDAQPSLILTQANLQASLQPFEGVCLLWEALLPTLSTYAETNPPSRTHPDALVFVPYTSGSTGIPKGVEICHRGIVRLVTDPNYLHIQPRDRFVQLSPIAFDASLLEIWGSLLNGATLVLYPDATFTLAELGRLIQQEHITILWLTAGLFRLMVEEQLATLGQVRYLLTGGDRVSVPHAQRVLAQLPQCQLINGYGPTEATTFTTCYPIQSLAGSAQTIPIGRPINNTQIYVLDADQQLAPIGVPGELYVGGDGVARGYRNREDLTADRFVPNPFSTDSAARLYRTGDRVRFRRDGVLEFLGRQDRQVKIRGFRVEPGEIEAVLLQHPLVAQSYVTCQPIANEQRLIAYIVPTPDARPTLDDLTQFLRQRLPDYFIPSGMQLLDQLPITPNGKIDHAALPVPEAIAERQSYTAPETAVQRQLVLIWEELLGVQPIGIHDNFWELGGHSLLAVSLFARLAREFDLHLPLATLFSAPTIAALAQTITSESPSDAVAVSFNRSLVPIKPQGSKPPFFCVHGAGGNPLVFLELAQRLDPEQPFYALQLPGLDGLSAPYRSLEEMATAYLNEIQQVQPHGPYLLGGFSFGGVVAFEIAQQLQAKGQSVAQLVLFDTSILQTPQSLWSRANQCVQQVRQDGLSRIPPLVASLNRFLYWRTRWLWARVMRSVFLRLRRPLPHRWQKDYAVETCERVANGYQPQPYIGSVALFHSTQFHSPFEQPLTVRWQLLVGVGLFCYPIDSEHIELLSESAVERFVPQLQSCLNAASDSAT